MRNVEEFELNDDYGEAHKYRVTKHGFREGKEIGREIARLIGRSFVGGPVSEDGQSGVDINISEAISSIAEGLSDKMVDALFRHTMRDGQAMTSLVMDSCYSGNYGEFLEATIQIIRINFSGIIEKAKSGKFQLSEP